MGAALATGPTLGCEAAGDPDVPAPVATGADAEACAPAQPVAFTWSLEPVPEDMSLAAECVITEVKADADLAVALECAEAGGPRVRTLWVSATPGQPRTPMRAGQAVRLWALEVEDEAQGRVRFVRLETSKGALLVAAAEGGSLLPQGGEDPWLPFTFTAATTRCMSEETACGAQARAGIDLRRAGGPPTIAQDGSFAEVGDRGEAQLWVAAALRGDEGCVGPTGAWYSLGLVATR